MESLTRLPAATRAAYTAAFTGALNTVFFVAAVVCAIGVVLSFFLPEHPLRTTIAEVAGDVGDEAAGAFARPSGPRGAERQLQEALGRLADRDVQREHIARIVQRAGESLSPLAAWFLSRAERVPDQDPGAVARANGVAADRVDAAMSELLGRGLVSRVAISGGTTSSASAGVSAPSRFELTDAGCEVLGRLVTARREHLTELAADWNPERDGDATVFLRDAVREMIPDVQRPRTSMATGSPATQVVTDV